MTNTVFANDTYTEAVPSEMRAAIYCRLSKDDESEGDSSSIQTQRAMLEHYCAQQGWEVVSVYQDDGFTGLNMNRPDLTRMLKAIERRQIDVVVTKTSQGWAETTSRPGSSSRNFSRRTAFATSR